MVIAIQVHQTKPCVRLSITLEKGTFTYDLPHGAALALAEGLTEAVTIVDARKN